VPASVTTTIRLVRPFASSATVIPLFWALPGCGSASYSATSTPSTVAWRTNRYSGSSPSTRPFTKSESRCFHAEAGIRTHRFPGGSASPYSGER